MTSADESPKLIRAAEAVSDGVPLDAGGAAGDERRVMESLQAIETIARVHREVAAEAGAPAAGTPAAGGTPAGHDLTPPPAGAHETWGPLVLIERIGGGAFGD